MTLQGHIQEHIGMMAEAMAQQEITAYNTRTTNDDATKSTDDARDANTDTRSAVIIGELTEKYAQH